MHVIGPPWFEPSHRYLKRGMNKWAVRIVGQQDSQTRTYTAGPVYHMVLMQEALQANSPRGGGNPLCKVAWNAPCMVKVEGIPWLLPVPDESDRRWNLGHKYALHCQQLHVQKYAHRIPGFCCDHTEGRKCRE